ncbi:hypothetical protein ACBJ59_36740 [Nonomuraea sp. MTCD27]|uniref:hypothetical protein n=1 Tax=Nonomuraea sp. MTCD27 TaxID=1676747 RepID=UPI0035C03E85
MSTFFLVLLSAVALALCAVRDDSPTAQTYQQMWTSLRRLGWRRVVWLAVQAVVGVALVLLMAALRSSLYGLLAGVAAGASWLASLIALHRASVYTGLELRS